jgi:excisionase family DNA binding protein
MLQTTETPETPEKGKLVQRNGVKQERIKIKDVAGHCMVSQTTVRRWIENGQLEAIRLPSGHYRINRVDYRRFLRTIESKPVQERGLL